MNKVISIDISEVKTQREMIMYHLQKDSYITSIEAFSDYGITRLSSIKKEITLEVIISYERSYSYKTVEKLRTISRKIDKQTVKELIKQLKEIINE